MDPALTSLRIRAVPVGAAIALTRRALAVGGDRFTLPAVLEHMGRWWELDRVPIPDTVPELSHPFTFALKILETPT